MDQIDRAKELDQMHRTDALARHSNRAKEQPYLIDGLRCCPDCDDVITNERLTANPDAIRCVECQNIKDKKDRGIHF